MLLYRYIVLFSLRVRSKVSMLNRSKSRIIIFDIYIFICKFTIII